MWRAVLFPIVVFDFIEDSETLCKVNTSADNLLNIHRN